MHATGCKGAGSGVRGYCTLSWKKAALSAGVNLNAIFPSGVMVIVGKVKGKGSEVTKSVDFSMPRVMLKEPPPPGSVR